MENPCVAGNSQLICAALSPPTHFGFIGEKDNMKRFIAVCCLMAVTSCMFLGCEGGGAAPAAKPPEGGAAAAPAGGAAPAAPKKEEAKH